MGYYKNNPGAQRGHKVVDIDVSQVVKLLNEIDIENAIPKAERKKDFAKCDEDHAKGSKRRL